jgi:hypothetical protein
VRAEVPRVVVDRQGFSQRPNRYGAGSKLSCGLFLHNTSDTQDAMNVYVLVNMVADDGELVGTVAHTVALVSSGQTFADGDSLGLRTEVRVAKLEVTIRIGSHQPSGSRMVFLATSGFDAIPLDRALTPVVSVEPTYSAG